ncbi:MAG TPA: 2OG-Fe(II) oxygenase family protein [Candidatus Paceibacterota bacterium]|nr:2OG-Fe(II) oxygenase family protein [Candidatus Paceibacterota bacterium]
MTDQVAKNLETIGVVNVMYPNALRTAVEQAVASWKDFCALPEKVRAKFPYNPGEGMGVGYEIKKTPGATLDLKEDFHLTLASREWLLETAATCDEPTILKFVTDAESLISIMRPTVEGFAEVIEQNFDLADFAKDIAGNSDWWFIRFLHYFGNREEGEEIATAHVDKSAFTLHLYESHPGLQHLTYEGNWEDMPVSEGETAIIPGMRLQYRSDNRLRATCHRVVATKTTAQEGRYSAVCFIHPKNTPVYDKARAGRLQEFAPGFNYTMSLEEFRNLFTVPDIRA